MTIRWLRQRDLILFLFFFITLGQAAPYINLAGLAFQTSICSCCTMRNASCPRCAKMGHNHHHEEMKVGCDEHNKDKKDIKDDTDKKSSENQSEYQAKLNPVPCSSQNTIILSELFQNPFLLQKDYEVLPLLNTSTKYTILNTKFSSHSEIPEVKPPRQINA